LPLIQRGVGSRAAQSSYSCLCHALCPQLLSNLE
jgi:hypothetical protein